LAPIHLAVVNKNIKILLKILDVGNSSKVTSLTGATPLTGCFVDCISETGKTALQSIFNSINYNYNANANNCNNNLKSYLLFIAYEFL
jgi:hypothetical protein